MANLKIDQNYAKVAGGITDDASQTIQPIRVNPVTNRLLTETTTTSASSIGTGTVTVATAGIAFQLPDIDCSKVFIQAYPTNSGVVVVGDGSVVAVEVNRRGLALYPTQGNWFTVSNLNLLYIDAETSGNKVNYFYEV